MANKPVNLKDKNGNTLYPVPMVSAADAQLLNIPVIQVTSTDPGEGVDLAANHFIAVYGGESRKIWTPDYDNTSSTNLFASTTAASAPDNGFVVVRVNGYKTTAAGGQCDIRILVNNVIVARDVTEAVSPNGALVASVYGVYPVSKNDAIAIGNDGSMPALNYKECYFIPGKFV